MINPLSLYMKKQHVCVITCMTRTGYLRNTFMIEQHSCVIAHGVLPLTGNKATHRTFLIECCSYEHACILLSWLFVECKSNSEIIEQTSCATTIIQAPVITFHHHHTWSKENLVHRQLLESRASTANQRDHSLCTCNIPP